MVADAARGDTITVAVALLLRVELICFFYLHSIFSGKEAVPMNKIKCTEADMITLGELIALLTLIVSIAMLVVMIVK